ncbi:MAG TPA: DUF3108 domain-containing protein [Stellaceae bacterium]|nr:DUF3108 domain-containing protein [Stellaceae bacterium]
MARRSASPACNSGICHPSPLCRLCRGEGRSRCDEREGLRPLVRLFVLLASLGLGTAAEADDTSAVYAATWAGLPAAHIRLTLHDAADGYRSEIAISSEGLPHLVTHFRGTAVAEGKLGAATVHPQRFDADYDLRRRKDRKLRMAFVARDGAVFADRGAQDTSRKPPLKEPFRRNVIDPLSAITAIRAAVRNGDASFTIPVYDGARRFDAKVRVLPRNPTEPGVHLALLLHAIAGFKGETSEDGDPDDAPRPVSLTLSDDARLMPLAMSVNIWFLPLDAVLERYCTAAAPCRWER